MSYLRVQSDLIENLSRGTGSLIGQQASYKVGLKIGQAVLMLNRKRITRQENPDGAKFAPRKKGRNSKKTKKKMLKKILKAKTKSGGKTTKRLIIADGTGITVVVSSLVQYAHVHQHGKGKYAKRQVLGLSKMDAAVIQKVAITGVAENLSFFDKGNDPKQIEFGYQVRQALLTEVT